MLPSCRLIFDAGRPRSAPLSSLRLGTTLSIDLTITERSSSGNNGHGRTSHAHTVRRTWDAHLAFAGRDHNRGGTARRCLRVIPEPGPNDAATVRAAGVVAAGRDSIRDSSQHRPWDVGLRCEHD